MGETVQRRGLYGDSALFFCKPKNVLKYNADSKFKAKMSVV